MAYPLSVKSVTFQQRYPWNGLVNIDFGVTGPAGEKDVVVTVRDGEAEVTNFTAAVTIPEGGELSTSIVWDATTAGLAADFKSEDVTVEVAFAGEAAVVPVQLWADGPYWATVNVGTAEPGAPSEYGALYTFDNATNEVAKLDDGWRLPTKEELTKLDGETSGYCKKAWDATKKGYTFTGATEGYTDKSIFLPAADYNYGYGRTEAGSKGYYWSSTEDGSYNAMYLYFMENGARVNTIDRSYGLSVRAVRDTPSAPSAPVASDIAAKSEAGALDLRTAVTLAEGEVTVAGVNYSDTAWGAADQAAVTLGWTNETTGASDVIQTGLEGEGKTDISLPKRNGAYRLTHSTGGLTSFVEFMVEGWPEVKIPVVTGYTYVVSNETAEVMGTLADGTNTYVVAKGSELKVYFTLDKNYQFVGTPDNPMVLGAINESKVIDIESLPKAELGPISYLDWDGETMTNAVCKVYEEYTGQTTLDAGTTYVVMENKEVSTRITVNGTVESPTRIILCDGAKLTAEKGVEVVIGKALVICGQSESEGMGALTATGGDYAAGIGGNFDDGGVVTINGGTVTATGGYCGAGIGGGAYSTGGMVTINGGKVIAAGGVGGAGIGSGYDDGSIGTDGGVVTINGGTVTATGGDYAAGIGGGRGGEGGVVTINGGTVTATGCRIVDKNGGAGIGGGYKGAGGTVTINNGTVTANGGNYSAGIGGGVHSAGATVTINGGEVTAIAGMDDQDGPTVAIGGGQMADNHGTVTFGASFVGGVVAGDDAASAVYMTTDEFAADHSAKYVTMPKLGLKIPVVTGYTYVVSNETAEVTGTLADGTNTYVVAKGSELKVYFTLDKNYQFVGTPDNPMVLGAINESKVIDIESLPKAELGPISYLDWDDVNKMLTNAVCKVYEEYTGQTALSAGTTYVVMENKEVSSRITVNGTVESPTRLILCDGAKLTAQEGVNVASDNALVIYGQENGTGALEATGSNYSAGIGGGFMGNGGTVTINGGAVMAMGDWYAAGIGGGAGGSGGTITINGGDVTATGGVQGAGIGGGDAYNLGMGGGCGTITINGGTVTATGGQYGAGIGGGSDNVEGGTIAINGGDVTATGTFGTEGIGRGCEGLVDCTVTFGADKDFILKIGDDAASTVYFPQAQYVTDHSAAYANIKAADVVLLKIPSPTEGFFYAVTNVTDAAGVEVIGTLEDGTYTCAFANGDSYEVTYTLEYGYDWVTSPASNPLTGTITEDTALPEVTVKQLGADVEFNAMGGAYSDGSEVVTTFCVLVYTMPATPTRTDYEFLGWYDSWKADAAKVEEGSVLKEYSPHSIYAKWKSTKFEPSEDEEVIKTDGNGVIVAQEVEPTGELILPEMNRGGSSGVANVEIGEDAFLKNTGITSVSLPVFVKKIGSYAFANATGISKIKFVQPRDATTGENTTLTIGDGAFSGLSLTKIELPPYVASIGAKAFAGNTKLTDLTIMGPTTIDWEARPFLNCGTATLDGKVTLHLSYEVATNKDYATKLWDYVENYADNIVIDFNPYGTAKVLRFGSDFVEFEARIDTLWPTIDINSVKVLTTTELTGADLEKTWTTVPLTNVTPVEGNVYRATFEGQGGGTRFYQIAIVMPAEEN